MREWDCGYFNESKRFGNGKLVRGKVVQGP